MVEPVWKEQVRALSHAIAWREQDQGFHDMPCIWRTTNMTSMDAQPLEPVLWSIHRSGFPGKGAAANWPQDTLAAATTFLIGAELAEWNGRGVPGQMMLTELGRSCIGMGKAVPVPVEVETGTIARDLEVLVALCRRPRSLAELAHAMPFAPGELAKSLDRLKGQKPRPLVWLNTREDLPGVWEPTAAGFELKGYERGHPLRAYLDARDALDALPACSCGECDGAGHDPEEAAPDPYGREERRDATARSVVLQLLAGADLPGLLTVGEPDTLLAMVRGMARLAYLVADEMETAR